MQIRHFLAPILLASAWILPTGAAQADQVLYDSAGFIQGAESFTQSFDITTPGILTVTLQSIPWLDTISNLNSFVSTATSVVGQPMSWGSESIKVGTGTFYAHWFGDANGAFGVGAYGIEVSFHPGFNTTTPVSLPATFVLLLSGLGVLLGWQRQPRPEHELGSAQRPPSALSAH